MLKVEVLLADLIISVIAGILSIGYSLWPERNKPARGSFLLLDKKLIDMVIG